MSRLEDRIMDLAARQHGLVTRCQLLGAGLGRDAINYRIRVSRLRPVHRGVYRIGPVVAPRAPEMAAVLACGPEAVLSFRSAAVLWKILPRGAFRAPVDVTVRTRNRRRREGIRVHRDPGLGSDEVIDLQGIPTTTSTRTVFDVAAVLGPSNFERALARADKRGFLDLSALSSLAARDPARRGSGTLRGLLQSGGGNDLTRSEAEERFLAMLKRAELPRPEVNVSLGSYEVDFLWRVERLVGVFAEQLRGRPPEGRRAGRESLSGLASDLAADRPPSRSHGGPAGAGACGRSFARMSPRWHPATYGLRCRRGTQTIIQHGRRAVGVRLARRRRTIDPSANHDSLKGPSLCPYRP